MPIPEFFIYTVQFLLDLLPMSFEYRKHSNWFVLPQPNDRSRLRLFCFPYAGGGASLFRRWSQFFPSEVEVRAVQLPGREERASDPLIRDLDYLLLVLFDEFKSHLDKPFLLFGHSLGALIAYRLTTIFQQRQLPLPAYLIVSGARAPHLPLTRTTPISQLSDSEFIQELRDLNGIPKPILQDEEVLSYYLPLLRADFALSERSRSRMAAARKLECSVLALGGVEDTDAPKKDIEAWQEQTTREFNVKLFSGDHFFIHSSQDQVLLYLNSIVSQVLRS